MKHLLSILIILSFVGCDSYFNSSSKEDSKINKICSAMNKDLIKEDCRKGEIFTVTITESVLKIPEDIHKVNDIYDRLNTVVAQVCDFSKQIVIKKVHTDAEDKATVYDLTCVYSGGYQVEIEKDDPLGLFEDE